MDYDTNGVTYAFTKAGGVKFVADGEGPDNIETVTIKVQKKEGPRSPRRGSRNPASRRSGTSRGCHSDR